MGGGLEWNKLLKACALLAGVSCAPPCGAVPPKKHQPTPAVALATTSPKFTSSDITLLYEACEQSGGIVSINGSEFICRKGRASGISSNAASDVQQVPESASSGKRPSYSGASMAEVNSDHASGDITTVHSIDKLLPLIRVNVTTREQIVAALKEPISSSFDSTGTETAVFREQVAFWKSGGVGQLFTKRGPVKRTLVVYFKQGRVSYFQSGDQR